jgi:hypothetical protein
MEYVQFHTALTPEYRLRRLGGHRTGFRRCGEEYNPIPIAVIKIRFSVAQPITQALR